MPYLLFIGFIIFLFLLAQQLTRQISHLLMRFFHSQEAVVYILSFLFLPGVILHELSHLLLANILFVPTGEVEFFPEIRGNSVKMGSVAVAKTDPLRRFLIGVAPILGGLGIMLVASSYLPGDIVSWQGALLLYIFFQVANTMFSSKKDMEGAVGFLVAAALIAIILEFLGIPVWQSILFFLKTDSMIAFFSRLNFFLALASGVDFLVLFFLFLPQLLRR